MRRLRTLLLAPLLTAACSVENSRPAPEVVTTDSLGVSVRTWSHTPADVRELSIDPTPLFQIGALDGDAHEVFGRITSLRMTEDGRIVVADEQAGALRTFSSTGEHLGSVGGLGEGPGEFNESAYVLGVSGDTIVAWDGRLQRISVFADGAFVETRPKAGEVILANPVLVGDRLFAHSNNRLGGRPETGMNRPGVVVAVIDHDGEHRSLFESPGHERHLDIQMSGGQIAAVAVFQPAFARGFFFTAHGVTDPRILGGPNDRLELREWDADGVLRAVHRFPGLDRAITEDDVARARERIIERYEEPTARMSKELAALDATVPELHPAFDRVRVDDASRIWLRRSVAERVEEWLLLDVDGTEPIGRVVLPEGFTLLHVRGERLAGSWRDELDVAHVRVYRMEPM